MAGWKFEFGLRYKDVLSLLDHQSLREGKIVCVQAPDREVYTRDEVVFLLSDIAEKGLGLEKFDPLPIPFIEDSPELRKKYKRIYITYGRIQMAHPITLLNLWPGMKKNLVKHRLPLRLVNLMS